MRTAIPLALFGVFSISIFAHAAAVTNVTIVPDSSAGNVATSHPNTLSPDEWQELRMARMAALKANPELITKAVQLSEKLRQFEQKLNAAMLKTDPNIAPVLAKFAANRLAAPHSIPQPPPKSQ
jgi:hypothetical protein